MRTASEELDGQMERLSRMVRTGQLHRVLLVRKDGPFNEPVTLYLEKIIRGCRAHAKVRFDLVSLDKAAGDLARTVVENHVQRLINELEELEKEGS